MLLQNYRDILLHLYTINNAKYEYFIKSHKKLQKHIYRECQKVRFSLKMETKYKIVISNVATKLPLYKFYIYAQFTTLNLNILLKIIKIFKIIYTECA